MFSCVFMAVMQWNILFPPVWSGLYTYVSVSFNLQCNLYIGHLVKRWPLLAIIVSLDNSFVFTFASGMQEREIIADVVKAIWLNLCFISILCHCKVLEVNFVLLCVILLAVLTELMLDVTISASIVVISCFIVYVILCLKLIIVIFIRQYFLMSLSAVCGAGLQLWTIV